MPILRPNGPIVRQLDIPHQTCQHVEYVPVFPLTQAYGTNTPHGVMLDYV